MTLMRTFLRVDKEGKIGIPANIKQVAELKEGTLAELKIVGTGKKSVLVTARKCAR